VRQLLIPDAGPLFSLAAADVLAALLHFSLVITDVVKTETIDKGALAGASAEAVKLHAFYQAHRARIEIRQTQFGSLLAAARRGDPRAKIRNAGELSIQSLLIELGEEPERWEAVVLFEDAWFVRHAVSLPPNCRLVGTTAFLHILEELGLIDSAEKALERVRGRRAIK
jgi:hypothetical protein